MTEVDNDLWKQGVLMSLGVPPSEELSNQVVDVLQPSDQSVVDALELTPEEKRYCWVALVGDRLSLETEEVRDVFGRIRADTAVNLRRKLEEEGTEDSGLRLDAINLALEVTKYLADFSYKRNEPNFPRVLKEVVAGLVNREEKRLIKFKEKVKGGDENEKDVVEESQSVTIDDLPGLITRDFIEQELLATLGRTQGARIDYRHGNIEKSVYRDQEKKFGDAVLRLRKVLGRKYKKDHPDLLREERQRMVEIRLDVLISAYNILHYLMQDQEFKSLPAFGNALREEAPLVVVEQTTFFTDARNKLGNIPAK